jgi:Immunoglobulin V-set domain
MLRVDVKEAYSNITAVTGHSVTMPCMVNSNNEPVAWTYWTQIFVSGSFVNGFGNRFSVHTTKEGHYGLFIKTVVRNDAGFYECFEEHEMNPEATTSTRLSVTGLY